MSDVPMTDEAVLRLRQEREAFVDRVRENERLAAADPALYRRKLRNLVLLGYGYIGLILLVVFALTVALVLFVVSSGRLGTGVLKIGLLLAFFLFAILKSLWIKFDPPEGVRLDRERASTLWKEIEAIADRLQAPRPDEIRIDEDFNASASRWPRFGMFGDRAVLTLGLPLLANFSPDEARAVIAHEFGHFSGKHERFGMWIYRVNQTWAQLAENLGDGRSGAGVFKPFVRWFFPRFSATSFAIRRQDEYEADRAAAEVVGAPTVARMLARISPLAEHQQRAFWKPLEQEWTLSGRPASGFMGRLAETARAPIDAAGAERKLRFALSRPTDYDDTHPSLTDRLRSLGQPPPEAIEPLQGPTAAEAFFGSALPSVVAEVEAYFSGKMEPFWAHLEAQRAVRKSRLKELRRETRDRPPSEKETVEIAFLRAGQSPKEALEIYRELRDALPENPSAVFLLGQELVEADDSEGVALLESAAARDREFADPVRSLLASYHARNGDLDTFERLRTEAQEAYDRQVVAEGASMATLKDEFLPPDLSSEEVDRIRTTLAKLKGLGRAYAFRKRLPGTGELRDYLYLAPSALSLAGNDPLAYYLKQFGPDTDLARSFTIVADANYKAWEKRLRPLPGSVVYDKKAK